MNFETDVDIANALHADYQKLLQEIGKQIYGQDEIVKKILISIFSNGHCLLVGVPGLAKTLLVNTIAQVLDLQYQRIQFTPDLMPSDIIGTEILNKEREFKFVKGALFANIILADEINRTPPKTQSALLEAMQEKKVTANGKNYEIKPPFFVLATQNPIEQEGTYPLPEAQLDRFMFSIHLDYPKLEDEVSIVANTTSGKKFLLNKIISSEKILNYQQLVQKVPINQNVLEYAVHLSAKSRPGTMQAHPIANKYINWGAGPRASQYLVIGAKANALLSGKYSPDIEDVKAVALSVLRHRIMKNYKAEAERISTETIITELLK